MNKRKKILLIATLIATQIVLGRFLSIRTPILTIGFSFIPIILSAIILKPKYTLLVCFLSDIIGAILFPSGAFFIGYTISSVLTGLVYSLLLYNKDGFKYNRDFIIKLIIGVLIVNFLIHGLLNTYWIMITVNKAVNFFAPIRFIKQLIMAPIKVITIIAIVKKLENIIKELQHDCSI